MIEDDLHKLEQLELRRGQHLGRWMMTRAGLSALTS